MRANIDPSQIFLLEKDMQQEKNMPKEEDVHGNLAIPSQKKSYVKRLCPACFEPFYPGDCQIVSRQSGRVLKLAPTGWIATQQARLFPERLDGKYALASACRRCPNLNCGYLLPHNIERVRNIHLAIVGDLFSGKSEYIASLIHELQQGRWLPQQQHFRLTCLTPSVEEEMFLKKGRTSDLSNVSEWPVLGPTQPATRIGETQPLIYELHVSALPNQQPTSINLIFYDTSGEDYMHERMSLYGRHVLNADAIIFLVDPQIMPNVVSRLPTYLRTPSLGSRRRVTALFNETVNLFMDYHKLSNMKAISIPIAITLSKSDLFKFLRASSQSYLFSRQLVHIGLDLAEVDEIDKEVRKVFADFSDSTLLQATNGLPKTKCFAISATGCPTKPIGSYYPFFEPCRCLDPLLWILHQLNIYHT